MNNDIKDKKIDRASYLLTVTIPFLRSKIYQTDKPV